LWRGRIRHDHILGHDRSQLLLLPEAVDDYRVADNPVGFIGSIVDGHHPNVERLQMDKETKMSNWRNEPG